MPSNSEKRQRQVSSEALSTRRWGLHSRAQEKGTRLFESSMFHLHEEESEHEHKHTSTSEDDLLKLMGLPGDTQTWTRFDKKSENLSHHVILGSIGENVVARIAIDDKNWSHHES